MSAEAVDADVGELLEPIRVVCERAAHHFDATYASERCPHCGAEWTRTATDYFSALPTLEAFEREEVKLDAGMPTVAELARRYDVDTLIDMKLDANRARGVLRDCGAHDDADRLDAWWYCTTAALEVAPIKVARQEAMRELLAAMAPDGDSESAGSWDEVDLGPALDGSLTRATPLILQRDDGVALLYAGRINGLHAESGIGKSWLAQIAASQELAGGRHVAWIDFEDPDETTVIDRLRLLGISDDVLRSHFHYFNPQTPASPGSVAFLRLTLDEYGPMLVVVDSVGEALGANGANESVDLEVDEWKRVLPGPLERDGHSVLLIDHSTKANDNPLHASGSKRKRAMFTGASWLVEEVTPFDREHPGKLKLTCAKDRHGNFRRRSVGAWVHIDPTGDRFHVHIEAPAGDEQQARGDTADAVMVRRVVAAAKAAGADGLTLRGLRAAVRTKAKVRNEVVDDALALAQNLGAVTESAGPRGARVQRWARDLTEAELNEVFS